MKKQVIYTNKDNQDFTINGDIDPKSCKKHVLLEICYENPCLYFLDKQEVEEFCEILKLEAEKTFGP